MDLDKAQRSGLQKIRHALRRRGMLLPSHITQPFKANTNLTNQSCNELYQYSTSDQKFYRIPKEWFGFLKDHYGFDPTEFYKNIIWCNNGPPDCVRQNQGLNPACMPNGLLADSEKYPSCMFGLVIMKTSRIRRTVDEYCYTDNEKDLPEWLQEKAKWHLCYKMDGWSASGA